MLELVNLYMDSDACGEVTKSSMRVTLHAYVMLTLTHTCKHILTRCSLHQTHIYQFFTGCEISKQPVSWKSCHTVKDAQRDVDTIPTQPMCIGRKDFLNIVS